MGLCHVLIHLVAMLTHMSTWLAVAFCFHLYLLQGQQMDVIFVQHDHTLLGNQPFLKWLGPCCLQSTGQRVTDHTIANLQHPTQLMQDVPCSGFAWTQSQMDTPWWLPRQANDQSRGDTLITGLKSNGLRIEP